MVGAVPKSGLVVKVLSDNAAKQKEQPLKPDELIRETALRSGNGCGHLKYENAFSNGI